MTCIFSAASGGGDTVAISDELMDLVVRAFNMHGHSVEIPATVVKNTCGELPSETTEEILEIRKQERAVSSQTLGLHFS